MNTKLELLQQEITNMEKIIKKYNEIFKTSPGTY